MNLRKHKGNLLNDPEIEKTAKSLRKKAKERKVNERQESMADNMITRQELERAIAERLEAERFRWLVRFYREI